MLRIDSADFLADPAPTLARIRESGPLAAMRVPLVGRISVTTSDAAARSLLKDGRFLRDPRPITGKSHAQSLWFLPRFLNAVTESMILKDGAEHRRLRHLVELAFARMTIEDLAPDLATMANALLDDLPTDRPVDLVPAFARPLPLHAISLLLGVAPTDRDRIARLVRPVTRFTPASIALAMPGLWRLIRHFRAEIARLRENPAPGLLSWLVHAETEDGRLTDDELLSFAVLLFMAGHETTVHLISDALASLLTRPEDAVALQGDPAGLPIAVEEFVRFHSPVMMTKMMTASEDLEFEGCPVAKGTRLSALLIAANHDPARVEAPGELRLDRRPNPHLGFGFGPHVCLGMQLARVETRVALESVLSRFPEMRLADMSRPPRYARRLGIRGVASLPVVLRP